MAFIDPDAGEQTGAMKSDVPGDKRLTQTLQDIEAGKPAPAAHWQGQPLPGYNAPKPAAFVDPDAEETKAETTPKDALYVPSAFERKQFQKAEDWTPYVLNEMKKGAVGTFMAAPTLLSMIPTATYAATGKLGILPERLQKLGEKDAEWIRNEGNRRVQEVYRVMGVGDVAVPKDITGKPSKGAEFMGQMANFMAAGLGPSMKIVSMAEAKLAAAVMEVAMTATSAESSQMGKSLGTDFAKQMGVSPERGAQIGEMVGSFFGPGMVASIDKALRKSGSSLADKLGMEHGISKEGQKEAAKQGAMRVIKEGVEATPSAVPTMQDVLEVSRQIPGFRPDIARATNAPSIKALKEGMMGKDATVLAKGAAEEAALKGALAAKQEASFPEGKVDYVKPLGLQRQVKLAAAEDEVRSIDRQLRETAARTSRFPQADVGAELKGLRDQLYTAEKKVSNEKYNQVYAEADKIGLRPDMASVANDMRSILGDAAQTWQQKPGIISEVLKKYSPAGGAKNIEAFLKGPAAKDVSFQEFHSLYKRANQELGEAILARDGDKVRVLSQLKQSLGQKVQALEGPENGKVGALFKDANAHYATNVVPRFQKGLGGRLDNTGRFGDITPDEDVVSRLVKSPTGMKEFFGLYGQDPKAIGTLQRGLYDDFSKSVIKNGQIDPTAAANYLRQNKETLDLIPGVQKELKSNVGMTEALLNRRDQVIQDRKALDQGIISQVLKAPHPGDVVKAALGNPAQLQQLARVAATNPEAGKSLARTIAGEISAMPNPLEYLQKNSRDLTPVMNTLGPNHMQNLMTIARGKEIVGRVTVPEHVTAPTLEDIGTRLLGTPIKGIKSQLFGKIRPSKSYATINLGGNFLLKYQREEQGKLLEAAMFNPDVASLMAAATAGKTLSKKQANDLANNLWSHGVRVLGLTGQVEAGVKE